MSVFQVVNNDPYEEQKDTEKFCSVDLDNPSCGIAMYDGKPIPFSEVNSSFPVLQHTNFVLLHVVIRRLL